MAGSTDFARVTDPFRREMLAHCYRMLGSIHDAEDLVQETYLRAWRSYDGFEGRASVRTWLYRIATNACLTALESRGRRPLPSGLGGPGDDPAGPLADVPPEVTWLQPMPDALVGDPAAIVASREGMRLALIAALQHLPPRQRAVLILRDVLAWRAAEVAELLDISTTAVNSALRRARAHLERVSPDADEVIAPDDPAQRALLDRYAAAFEKADVGAITALLTADTVWEMPPQPSWFTGLATVRALLAARCVSDYRMIPVRANGQPAFAMYDNDSGVFRAAMIQVLTVTPAGISRVVGFREPDLFEAFGLPPVLA